MKRYLRSLCLFLCLILLTGCAAPKTGLAQSADSFRSLLGVRGKILSHQDVCPAGSSSFDWMAMALKLSGARDDYDGYLSALARNVTDRYAKNGTLDHYKPTEFQRIALTVLALGGDPTAFGTDSRGDPVDLISDGTYNYNGDLGGHGLKSLVFALIALDAGGTGGRRPQPGGNSVLHSGPAGAGRRLRPHARQLGPGHDRHGPSGPGPLCRGPGGN